MQRLKIQLTSITIEDRQRKDYGDIEELADSLKRLGLIQPVVLDQNNRLIAGGRRCEAARTLGWTEIDVVYRETLNADELYELELEENIQRKQMTWQEEVAATAKIHELKYARNAAEGLAWGYRQTGAMLGISVGKVQYILQIAREIARDPEGQVAKAASVTDAIRVLLQRTEDQVAAELAKRTLQSAPAPTSSTTSSDTTSVEVSGYDLPDAIAGEESATAPEIVVPISRMLHHGDGIDWMFNNPGAVDHIITDPPYGIDMDMLSQGNTGMQNIDRIEETHGVEDNERMFTRLFPAAHTALRDSGYFVTWCDVMQWDRLYRLAVETGFKVQRWPITWVKMHQCMNQAAQYNFTKNTEIAMVCRKGKATMALPAPTCVVMASNMSEKQRYGHPFVKPFMVWEFLVRHLTLEGQTICEPFAGVGSGVLSFLQMRRNVLACEIDERHFNNLVENVRQHYLGVSKNAKFV
jgi:ParB family chromosome partitioning protein